MKKIEEYIEKIYKNFDEKNEETKILKEETKAHLLEEVEEFKKYGLTEEESINKAILNFGSEKVVINELNLILKTNNKFLKILLKLTLITFIIASLFKVVQLGDIFLYRNVTASTYDKNTSTYIIDSVEKKLKDENLQNEELKQWLNQLLDEFNNKNNNGIYYFAIQDIENSTLKYEYIVKDATDTVKGYEDNRYGSKWSIKCKTTNAQTKYSTEKHQEFFDKREKGIPTKLGQASNYIFLVSAVLLCVYIVSKGYLKVSLKK